MNRTIYLFFILLAVFIGTTFAQVAGGSSVMIYNKAKPGTKVTGSLETKQYTITWNLRLVKPKKKK